MKQHAKEDIEITNTIHTEIQTDNFPDKTTSKDADSTSATETESPGENALEISSLGFKEQLTYKLNKQKQILSEMDGKQKRQYIFQYYKWHFFVVIMLIIGITELGKSLYQSTFPTLLNLAFINNDGKATMQDYAIDSYRKYYDLGTNNHINIYTNLHKAIDNESVLSVQSPAEEAMAYTTLLNILDIMICDEKALELYVSDVETIAIDSVLPEDIYKKIEDKVVIKADPYKIKYDGKPYSIAIDVSNTEFIKNCNLSYDTAYLVIPSTKEMNDENVIRFINFIFDLQ